LALAARGGAQRSQDLGSHVRVSLLTSGEARGH
jgi:hypothetical protein